MTCFVALWIYFLCTGQCEESGRMTIERTTHVQRNGMSCGKLGVFYTNRSASLKREEFGHTNITSHAVDLHTNIRRRIKMTNFVPVKNSDIFAYIVRGIVGDPRSISVAQSSMGFRR